MNYEAINELGATILVGILILIIWRAGRASRITSPPGYALVVCGVMLLFVGRIVDITDNYPSLNRFVVIGDTFVESLIEELVCATGGLLLIIFGLHRWLPWIIAKYRDKEQRLVQQNAELEQARCDAEAANLFKTQFLANVSHELRTPLQAILSFSRFAEEDLQTGDHERLADSMQQIRASGERQLKLVNNLLDLAKLEARQMTFEYCQEDLLAVVASVQCEFASMLSERRLRCALRTDLESLPMTIDPDRIRQVARNLIGNAIRHSLDDTAIEITIERLGDATASVRVRDHGPGIVESELQRIFERFYQTGRRQSAGHGGTGLGLAISREIIHAHGGTIHAENHPDRGAVFTVELPIRSSVQEPSRDAA